MVAESVGLEFLERLSHFAHSGILSVRLHLQRDP